MAYYCVSDDYQKIYIHLDSLTNSGAVWKLQYYGWEWDLEGRRWCKAYCKDTKRYAQKLCGAKAPAFIIPQGSYCGFWGNNIKWTLNSYGHLRITGTGEIPATNYDQMGNIPWYTLRSRVISITVEDGVTSVGKRAFYDLPNLRWITLKDSVITLGERALSRCSKLNHILLSKSLTTIGILAFQDCISLKEIHLPYSVTNLGSECFKNWTANQKIFKTVVDPVTGEYVELLCDSDQIVSETSTEIFFEDFVVITDNSYCINNGHSFEDIRARVNILQHNGNLKSVTIPAGYCRTCNRFFIRSSQFENMQNLGVILCRMVHENHTQNRKPDTYYDTLPTESWLRQYGYTTNRTVDLSDGQRQQILICLMESNPLARERIYRHLNWLIEQHRNQTEMIPAVTKWIADRSFVECYELGSARVVAMRSLKIRRYKYTLE